MNQQRTTVNDIQRGSTFRFNNEIWKVTEIYRYEWNDGSNSKEFKIKSKTGAVRYLETELNDNDELVCRVWTDIRYKNLSLKGRKKEAATERFSFNGKSYPKKIHHDGKEMFYFDQSSGYCSYGFTKESVDSLTYATQDKKHYLSLEVWEDEKELSYGTLIDKSSITNITEGKKGVSDYGIVRVIGRSISWIVIGFFIFIVAMMDSCDTSFGSNSGDPYYENDSTRVNKSNRNYYRNRNSRGYGK